MASKSSGLEPGQETNMDVDYVIVYRFGDDDKTQAKEQFNSLIEVLGKAGLGTEVRYGTEQTLLVFVRVASDEHLWGEVYRSRVRDWLHGIRVSAPEDKGGGTVESEPLTPAERLRTINQLITNPKRDGGAGITPKVGKWKNVESIFALHDHEYNKAWIKKMASTSMLKIDDLDQIRNTFGEKVAFYFAFTQAYFTALIAIAVFGIASWVVLGNFSPVYGVVNSILCILFIEYWKYQQQDLAIRWAVKGVSNIEVRRRDFVPDRQITDPVTGEQMQFFPAPKRLRRQLLQIPFALAAALGLGIVIATCFGVEIFVSEIYKGPGHGVLVFLPTIILSTVQPLLLSYLTATAKRLTLFENHATDGGYEYAMTQKIFVLNFITSYLGILLTAFVYVPFAQIIVPYLDIFSITAKPFADDKSQLEAPETGFQINPNRLKKQVIYFTVTAQIVNQLLEVVVPYLKRRGLGKVKQVQNKRAVKKGGFDPTADDPPEEKEFLKRVRHEAELEEYDVTTDFREMVVQYGYLSMFSVVWPITSLSFLVNNWIELRSDFVKIAVENKRPTPWRAESIGPWMDSLGFLTWLGSITTAAIVYMFRHGDSGPGGSPTNLRGWVLLLSIFFSEHTYLAIQWLVQLFISKLDSPGRQKERRERFQMRKQYLDEMSLEKQADFVSEERTAGGEEVTRNSLEEEARKASAESATPVQRFWKRQRGWRESAQVGTNLIEKALDAAGQDSKKQQ